MRRGAYSLIAIVVVLYAAAQVDLLSWLTRPLVVMTLQLFQISAGIQGDHLLVGDVVVPWTTDCSGLNTLALLWAVTLWSHRNGAPSRQLWARLGLAVPVAIIANAARVLTLIAYRLLLNPAVESPELHYLIAFIWLIPFLGLFAPRRGRRFSPYIVETLWIATILSITVPMAASPGGILAVACVLLFLTRIGLAQRGSEPGPIQISAWAVAGLCIALIDISSLWIPWLLVCPTGACSRSGRKFDLPWWLLPGTLPVIAMQPWAQLVLWPAVAIEGVRLLRRHAPTAHEPSPAIRSGAWGFLSPACLCACLLFPFVASALPKPGEISSPPQGAFAREVRSGGYEVRLLGQAIDTHLIWFGSRGHTRHHTLTVCMKFRGVDLRPVSGQPNVKTDGERWMREFFLLPDAPLLDYGSYLAKTFVPRSPAGIHVIASAPIASMGSSYFAESSEDLAERLRHLRFPTPDVKQ